jgi:predicted dehydrogenase
MSRQQIIRIGIVGCGAITEISYLPCFKRAKSFKLTCLVDTNESRAAALAEGLDLSYVGRDLEPMYQYTDAVIVAVPNHLHFPITKECLKLEKHVLCEKPLALTSEECNELISMQKEFDKKLAIAHVRRFHKSIKVMKRIVDSRELGDLISFDIEEGTIFNWPTVSGFIFDKAKAGGGVLMDIGIHILDLLLWLHPFEISFIHYEDDNLGGLEAYARLHMIFSSGVEGRVTISRLSILKNRYKFVFENGFVELDPVEWDPLVHKRIHVTKFSERRKKLIKIKRESPVLDLLSDFISAVQYNKNPLSSGEDGLKVIELIENCYRSRKLLPFEWLMSTAKA